MNAEPIRDNVRLYAVMWGTAFIVCFCAVLVRGFDEIMLMVWAMVLFMPMVFVHGLEQKRVLDYLGRTYPDRLKELGNPLHFAALWRFFMKNEDMGDPILAAYHKNWRRVFRFILTVWAIGFATLVVLGTIVESRRGQHPAAPYSEPAARSPQG